jgi:hypothetical protein
MQRITLLGWLWLTMYIVCYAMMYIGTYTWLSLLRHVHMYTPDAGPTDTGTRPVTQGEVT